MIRPAGTVRPPPGTSPSPRGPRRCWSSRCARRSPSSTGTSPTAISPSASSARARAGDESSPTAGSMPSSSGARSRPRWEPDHRRARAGVIRSAGIQLVVATPASWSSESSRSRASAGVWNSRVLRGRPLSLAAIGVEVGGGVDRPGRCPWGSTGAAGRWCSRWCRAARGVGVAEVDRQVGGDGDLGVPAISMPWSQVSERRRAAGSVAILAVMASRTASARWPSGRCSSITKRVERSTRVPIAGLAVLADDEVALPVPGHGPVVDLGRPLADHHLVLDPLPRPSARRRGLRSARPVRRQAVSSRRSAPRPCT